VVPDRSAKSAGGFIERTVKPGAAIITDDWSGYAKLGIRGYCHTAVAERGDTQVAETFLPIIHLVFSNLNTWLRGIHHGVSPQHLQAYLNEFTFRFNRRFNRRFYPFNAFRSLLGIAGDVIAPTYAELYAKKHDPLLHLMALGANRIRAQRLCPETALAGLQDGAIAVTFFELKSCGQPVR
jgi:transposase-like protein